MRERGREKKKGKEEAVAWRSHGGRRHHLYADNWMEEAIDKADNRRATHKSHLRLERAERLWGRERRGGVSGGESGE